jgi:molybdopterin synthase catalytic subunit
MLSLDRCIAAVRGDGMGGIATFTGMVRLHSRGTTIDHLEYEAYAPMAIKVMTELCDEIEAEIPGVRVAVEHRVGRLGIGDIAVVIAAAAPHRAEAFTACRAMIDRLKDRVPIWKKKSASMANGSASGRRAATHQPALLDRRRAGRTTLCAAFGRTRSVHAWRCAAFVRRRWHQGSRGRRAAEPGARSLRWWEARCLHRGPSVSAPRQRSGALVGRGDG